jgi:hypothetical protein
MALVSVSDAAAVIGCARNSVYRKIRLGELEAVDGPSGLLIELDGLRDRWRRISRVRSDSPRWMHQGPQEAAQDALKVRIAKQPIIGTLAYDKAWEAITLIVNQALSTEGLSLQLSTLQLQAVWYSAEELVFENLPLEHARSPEFLHAYGWL